MDFAERTRRCQEYVDALEEERKKIEVFQRELPLCLHLVTQAIESCRQSVGSTEVVAPYGGSDGDETSSEGPVLEEFIPIKRGTSSETEEEEEVVVDRREKKRSDRKHDWLRSVQLWNPDPDHVVEEEVPRKSSAVEVRKGGGGAFQPFHNKEKRPVVVATVGAVSTDSETGGGGGGGRGEKEAMSHRKARRCWSPELHGRFLRAIQQLGGSDTATPKQIRELMKVDGLTNDEVKSHLQKYRLHTKSPTPTVVQNSHAAGSNACQLQQFVLVGGIWAPPPEYASAAVSATAQRQVDGLATTGGLYAPIAALPPEAAEQKKRMRLQRSPHSETDAVADDEANSNSENFTVSSSSQTTTASPPRSR
ncbi:Two-component response regulator ARR18 [Acorus calamus]|uniref:Two-component response regulator ARR18 n=1 Tax=Acorus calamus TaxID=4465 RepID=A0AAV9FBF2_ACOCL|nr:Two-component response regulator ARR18 [Acorus calamus]